MRTMKEVAARSHVSTATVSRVINGTGFVAEDKRDRVMAAVDELNYRPNLVARGLRTQISPVIGFVISDIENPFFTSVCRGVEDAVNAAGFSLILCNADESEAKERGYLALLLDQNVSGIILTPASQHKFDIRPLRARDVKLVALDRSLGPDVDSVVVDNRAGAREATAHLISAGSRRLACITGIADTSTAVERLEGFQDALANAGLSAPKRWQVFSNFREDGGYAAMTRIMAGRRKPDAVFVANNRMTTGALHALRDLGAAIPDDVAIVGFDDLPWADVFTPTITTMSQPTYEMGASAAKMLLARINGDDGAPRHLSFMPNLLVRQSSMAR